MARLNLLPWREDLQRQRQQNFIKAAVLALLGSAVVLWGAHNWMDTRISQQQERNSFLQQKISQLDRQIKEVDALEETRKHTLAKLHIITSLQSSRLNSVHLFDELSTNTPDGVVLTNIDQRQQNISLTGMTQSNARISNYMRNIERSVWLAEPKLGIIENKGGDDNRNNTFRLEIAEKPKTSPPAQTK